MTKLKQFLDDNVATYRATKQVPYVFAVLIPFHILAVYGLYLGYQSWDWMYAGWFVAGWVLFGGLGACVGLHRWVSHKSIEVRPFMRPIMHWIMVCSCQGSAIWWASLHRGYHHAHADNPERDIHTPKDGFWHAYMGWMLKVKHDTINLKYGIEYLKDKSMVWHHKHYNYVLWGTLAVMMVIDPMFGFWFFVIPTMFSLHSDSVVNSVCHFPGAGYRYYNTKDQSVNVPLVGFLAWGQGWHNNHHKNPRQFDFGTTVSGKWWEFDPCLLLVPFVSPWRETKRLWGQWYRAWRHNENATPVEIV